MVNCQSVEWFIEVASFWLSLYFLPHTTSAPLLPSNCSYLPEGMPSAQLFLLSTVFVSHHSTFNILHFRISPVSMLQKRRSISSIGIPISLAKRANRFSILKDGFLVSDFGIDRIAPNRLRVLRMWRSRMARPPFFPTFRRK